MVPAHVEGAKGVVLVYDVTRGHTLERCVDLYHRLTEDLGNVPGVLVANKVDLRERAVVNRQQGAQLAGQLGMEHFECSAIDGYECDAPFAALAKMLHGSGGGDDGPGSPMSMS
jgi:GTPase SAR1 family protein